MGRGPQENYADRKTGYPIGLYTATVWEPVSYTHLTARKYTWNSVGVEGKTTVYKVEDGKLVTSETPGGFLDPSVSTVGAGAGGTFDGSGTKWKYNLSLIHIFKTIPINQ